MNRPRGGGGGGSEFSSITISSFRAMVEDLDSRADALRTDAAGLRDRASAFGVGQAQLGEIGRIAQWAEAELPMLRRRLALARVANSGADPSFPVVIPEPVTMPSAADIRAVRRIADRIRAADSAEERADALHDARNDLREYQHDPALMAEFFVRLGPDQTQTIARTLSANAEYRGIGPGGPAEVEIPPGQIQSDLRFYSRALGIATKSGDSVPGFGRVTESFTSSRAPQYDGHRLESPEWTRLALLQHGDFPPKWLSDVTLANGLDGFVENGGEWYGGMPPSIASNDLGVESNPYALAFSALADNPEAARSTIRRMGTMNEVVDTVYDSGPPEWDNAVADTFGLAIESGAGVHDESPGEHSPQAARFTFDFIQASGRHPLPSYESDAGPGPPVTVNPPPPPAALRDSLGRIAGSYSHEMLVGASTREFPARESSMTSPGDMQISGVSPAFYLSPEDTYRFLHGFAGEKGYQENSQPFDRAMSELWATAPEQAAEADVRAHENGRQDPRRFEATMQAFGDIGGMQYLANADVAGDLDAEEAATRKKLATVLTLGLGELTPQGMAAGYAWKAVSYAVGEGASSWSENQNWRVNDLKEEQDLTTITLQYDVARTLVDAEAPHAPLPPELRGEDGGLRSLRSIQGDESAVEAFHRWSNDNGDYFDNKLDDGGNAFLGGRERTKAMLREALSAHGDDEDWLPER